MLLVILFDLEVQRIGDAKVFHVPILHVGIVEVTQDACDLGVIEIVVPIRRVIHVKVLDKEGHPAPGQSISFQNVSEEPSPVTTARSNGKGEFTVLGTTPGHYVFWTEGEHDSMSETAYYVGNDDSDEEVQVILRNQE